MEIMEHLECKAADLFDELYFSINYSNQVFNEVIKRRKWKLLHNQIEMNYNFLNFKGYEVKYNIIRLDIQDKQFNDIAKLLGSINNWENPPLKLEKYIKDFGMEVAYILDKNEILGAIMWDDVKDTNFFRLEDVAISFPFRNQGIGTELIKFVLDKACKASAKSLFLSVEDHNINAHRLYESLGFYETIRSSTYKINI